MRALLQTAGEAVGFESDLSWVDELIAESSAGELRAPGSVAPSVEVRIEASRGAFDVRGWRRLCRGAWQRADEVVLENACTAGFDLHARVGPAGPTLTYRWRPPARDRVASLLLRSRFVLLARAVLAQYPALWWAGTRGRAPLHASAWTNGDATPLVTAHSGVGRSTLVANEVRAGGWTTGDNLGVGDGTALWGLVEPMRVEGCDGRSTTHGRREISISGSRADVLTPDLLVVLERGSRPKPSLAPCDSDRAGRALVAATYMAGELRRYWPFAATLGAGTGAGPAHPDVGQVAAVFAARLPAFCLSLGETPAHLSELLAELKVAA